MSYTNNMTKLLNKIERRLGTSQLNLPEHLRKDKWATIILEDTIPTFSRFFPNKITYTVVPNRDISRDRTHYLIDESIIPGDINILGVRDIKWDDMNSSSVMNDQRYGIYDFANYYSMEDIGMVQMAADTVSLFNNGMFLQFEYPNKIFLKNSAGANLASGMQSFNIELLIEHNANLTSISPTKMETFEALAKADVATWLFNELKYYDQLETVYANIDLKMSELEEAKNSREVVVGDLKDGYISAANENQPIMYTV